MTIGYVLDDTLDKSDGVQQAVIAIAENMRSLGHEVHYIVPYTERTDLENIHSIAKIISLKFNGNSTRTPIWSSKKVIKKLFKEVTFDVLHVQMPYSPIMSARVMKMAPKTTKIFGTFHILPYSTVSRIGTKILGAILYRSNKRFDAVFAVSPPALLFMKNTFRLDGRVIANPVDYNFFNKHATTNKNTRTRIVFLGRFDERKGVKQLVEAYKIVKRKENIELILCGKGPLMKNLENESKALQLGIQFTGFVTDEQKAQYLASADIAVFPSTGGESFGIVLAEAMAAGAGITIGGNNPGYTSVLEQWPETLFDPNNLDEFAEKLQEFVVDVKKRETIGRSQHDVVKLYDVKSITKQLLIAYGT